MSNESELDKLVRVIEQRSQDVFLGSVMGARDSVVEGSAITGAPGQPVDTGNLRASWQLTLQPKGPAFLTTNVDYAPAVEDGVGPHGPMRLKSAVGGFHSVKMTRINWPQLVDSVVIRVVPRV